MVALGFSSIFLSLYHLQKENTGNTIAIPCNLKTYMYNPR